MDDENGSHSSYDNDASKFTGTRARIRNDGFSSMSISTRAQSARHLTSHDNDPVASMTQPISGRIVRVPLPPQVRPGQRMQVRIHTGIDGLIPVSVPMFSEWRMDDQGNRYFNFYISATTTMNYNRSSSCRNMHSSIKPVTMTGSFRDNTIPYESWHDFRAMPYNPTDPLRRAVTEVKLSEGVKPVTPSGRRKALLVGINYVGLKSRLRGCCNDAKTMRHVLLQQNFVDDPEHMVVMIDENDEDIMSSSPLPTKENIRKGLQWLLQGATEGDILFFHFSGHGGQLVDSSGFESDGLNETILPVDFKTHGQITDDEIWDTLVFPLPEGVKLIAVMDCCHSGTGLDLPYDYMIKKGEWKEDVNPAHSKGDVVQFSGCRDSQYSADSNNKFKYGGAMTTAFVNALKTNPFATYGELLELIHKNLKERKFKQRPQLTSSQRFDVHRKAFSFTEGIEPNQNSRIGRTMRKQVKKKKKFGIF